VKLKKTIAGAVLATPLAWVSPAQAVEPGPRSLPTAPVTLITGDRVTVTGTDTIIERGAGRSGITFITDEHAGRLRVIPSDALPLLSQGRLDPRLFDVTALAELGDTLPLVVTAEKGGPRSTMTATGAKVTRDLSAVNGVAVQTPRADRPRFWAELTANTLAAGTTKVWLDGLRKPVLDTSVEQVGAPAAWQAGHTGSGVKVAVLDTGVDATHPDLAGRVAAQANFTEDPDGRDRVGHGTHVAATIAGSGEKYKGVAPGAQLLDAKVCAGTGCHESAILAGMQWAGEQGAKVVNMSLGGPDTPGLDLLEVAVAELTEKYGTLFVVAAGNSGMERSVSSPATADAALAVGAVTKDEALAEFSSRGPRVSDAALKPEITAPGVAITAARSKDSSGNGSHLALSGTSMATPHVAGAAAILAGQRPGRSAQDLKSALMGAARPNPALGVFDQGAGRLDVAQATTQSVLAVPAGVSFGLQSWPHDDDTPVTRKVTYRNTGTASAQLTLTVGEGPFTVEPAAVTVPAGGQAEVSVTADTGKGTPEGLIGGHLVATGEGVKVSTPLAVDNEVEHHELTLRHTARDGGPSTAFFTTVRRTDTPTGWMQLIDVDPRSGSTVALRLPKGRWQVRSYLESGGQATQLIHPGLDLTGSQTLDVDARLGKPLSVTLPDAAAKQLMGQVTYTMPIPGPIPGGTNTVAFIGDRFEDMTVARLGPDRTYDGVLAKVGGLWARPGPGGDSVSSPATYDLAWFHEGGMITGLRREVAWRDLAQIRADYATQTNGATGSSVRVGLPPGRAIRGYGMRTGFATPFTRSEYVNTDGGLQWRQSFWEDLTPDSSASAMSPLTGYRAGRTHRESWNRGVFSPALPPVGDGSGELVRAGDRIRVNVPGFGDGSGRLGWASLTRARITLHRDGEPVGELPGVNGEFTVPAGPALYRLVLESERKDSAVLSTRTSTSWTFRSEHAEDAEVPLPVSLIRFSPGLDARNSAPSGRPYRVPVGVESWPGAGRVRELAVDVSYDDGATWKRAEVRRGAAVLRHPAGDGFVSLRAKAADTSGNTVEQTVIRAYRITARH
jgi:subtilisin family serine protease